MRKTARISRAMVIVCFAALLSVGMASPARAQGFISPYLGWNFGGDAGCPQITNCEDKHANYGVAFGAAGAIVGFEEELGYTNDFFGQNGNQTSKVLTLMSNFMICPKFGPVQPYGLGGIGLIRTSVEGATSGDENQIGWDVGGGVMIFFNQHVGIRGDVRYYHSFQVLDFSKLPSIPGLNLSDNKLDYGRVAGAFVFRF
jgi:opacity protein-like surface antigen